MSDLMPATQDAQPPSPTSVYKYYDNHGILLYVGITSRGSQRNREHNQSKEWWEYVTRQAVEHFGSRPLALARETELIRQYRPPFNKQQNPDHEGMRAAYFLLISLPSERQATIGGKPATKKARQLVTLLEHELPLTRERLVNGRVVYSHTVARLPLAQSVNIVGTVHIERGRSIGKLLHAKQQGNRVFYTFELRPGVNAPPSAARMKIRVTQNPMTLWCHKVVTV